MYSLRYGILSPSLFGYNIKVVVALYCVIVLLDLEFYYVCIIMSKFASSCRKMWTSTPLMSHKEPFTSELASAWIFIINLSGYAKNFMINIANDRMKKWNLACFVFMPVKQYLFLIRFHCRPGTFCALFFWPGRFYNLSVCVPTMVFLFSHSIH